MLVPRDDGILDVWGIWVDEAGHVWNAPQYQECSIIVQQLVSVVHMIRDRTVAVS